MYTEKNKGFTVITNFGCDCNCPYCITKHHPILQNAITVKENIDWAKLEECIAASPAPTVNLSGGGDPFYHWQENLDFYDRVYKLAKKYGKRLDIHTRILPDDMELIKKFRKIALSVEMGDKKMIKTLKKRLPEIEKTTKLRVVNVLNERISSSECVDYIEQMSQAGVKQITFRQMFGNRKAYENFEKIRKQIDIPGVMFLPDGEYHNYYFTTNNQLYPYFFGYTETDRKEWMQRYEEIEQSCG